MTYYKKKEAKTLNDGWSPCWEGGDIYTLDAYYWQNVAPSHLPSVPFWKNDSNAAKSLRDIRRTTACSLQVAIK